MGEQDCGARLLGFCVAANIGDETAHGDGGLELQRGLRHFGPGAKVWVLPAQWGDDGRSAPYWRSMAGCVSPW